MPGEFDESKHPRDKGKFTSGGGTAHISNTASAAAHTTSATKTAGDHKRSAAAHRDSAAKHSAAADAHLKAAAKAVDPVAKTTHLADANKHQAQALQHERKASAHDAEAKAKAEPSLKKFADKHSGASKEEASDPHEAHEKNLETLDKIKEFVEEGGEKVKEGVEEGAEGDPLEAGAKGVGALGKAYVGMHTHAGALSAAAKVTKPGEEEKHHHGGAR